MWKLYFCCQQMCLLFITYGRALRLMFKFTVCVVTYCLTIPRTNTNSYTLSYTHAHPPGTFTPHNDSARWCTFSPDGNLLATASDDTNVCVFEVGSLKQLSTLTRNSERYMHTYKLALSCLVELLLVIVHYS